MYPRLNYVFEVIGERQCRSCKRLNWGHVIERNRKWRVCAKGRSNSKAGDGKSRCRCIKRVIHVGWKNICVCKCLIECGGADEIVRGGPHTVHCEQVQVVVAYGAC